VRLGLFLYYHLGGRKKLPGTRTLNLLRYPEGTPILDQYTRGFEYSDCWADTAGERVRTRAPFSAALTAFKVTRRASSTQ
ncbi:glycerol-3-phosphate dehydrogenase, partial [Rhizobium ruizarguesonis]